MTLFAKSKFSFRAGTAVIGIGLLAVVWTASFSASSFGGSDLQKRLDAKASALIGKATTGASLSQQATRFRSALSRQDFQETSRISAEALARDHNSYWQYQPFSTYLSDVVDFNDPSTEQHLDAWVKQDVRDPLPLIIRAHYAYSIGWHVRGGGFYSDINPADRITFQDHMRKAREDIDKAFSFGKPLPPYAYYLKFRALQNSGAPAEKKLVLEEAIRKYPDYYPIYTLALSDLQPKWHGSISAMYEFVRTHVDRQPESAPLRLLYLELYADLLNVASLTCNNADVKDDQKSDCMTSMMSRLSSSDLDENLRKAFALYRRTDRYQFGLAIRPPMERIIATRHAGSYALATLQMAATAMSSDVRLVEDNPGRNNYVIDELVAASWYQAGHYENALKKEEEALDDLARQAFPSDEERDRARAGIYLQISRAKGKLHDHAAQAAYQLASHALGGRNGYEHATCFAFFKIGTFDDVLSACAKAISDNSDDVESHYWRAQAYIDHKRGNDALPDLERVANSRDGLRVAAAIGMSMIFFRQNNTAAALGVLNKYSYLYDETATARSDIAIAYNNRCYAYMQLENLRKALRDCSNSLRFGSIPDAYKKKEELEKRLAGSPI